MLKTLSTKSAKLRKGRAGVGGDNRARCDRSKIDGSEMDNVKIDDSKVRDNEVGKKGRKTSKSKNLSKSKKTVKLDFFTSRAKLAFIKLRQAFLKALIFHHFDLKHHIRIKMERSGYAIDGVFSQLTLDNSG